MYTRDFRNQDDDNNTYDPNYTYELETYDLPLNCPYRQMLPSPVIFQARQVPHFGPHTAPPNFIPQETQAMHFGAAPFAVDPGAIRPCVFRFAYIWPRRGNGFWAWITFVGRRSISGFRWERNRWRYFGMSLREIRSFQCF